MPILEVTIRDLYDSGTDTVLLQGRMKDRFLRATDKSRFIAELETVSFSNPYVVSARNV